ncbi:MAG: OmpA family protein [Saprospiraceae bacterium]|nr:OmpA family protein [Saprospiraceae bacterium]
MRCRVVLSGFFLVVFFLKIACGQSKIELQNPSFEGPPHQGDLPMNYISSVTPFNPIPDWTDCGFKQETPPDLHGDSTGFFGVVRAPQHGRSFLGMVVRYNDTWERVSQKLPEPLIGGKCYKISLYLARDTSYKSATRENQRVEKSFSQPCVLRIHGGNGYCAAQEMLCETVPIKNVDWRKYEFILKPKENWNYIEFEAFYKTPVLFPYNGNILLDNTSAIEEIPCPEGPVQPAKPLPEVIAVQEPKQDNDIQVPKTTRQEEKEEPQTTTATPQPEPPVVQADVNTEKILKELDAKEIRKGQVIQIEKLYFEADKSNINPESYDVLNEVYDFLQKNPNVSVEIGGHTNGRPPHHFCDSLSTARAEAVANYLTNRGIDEERIEAKGYGKRKPIASNRTIIGRKRNQRVEIKILSVDG